MLHKITDRTELMYKHEPREQVEGWPLETGETLGIHECNVTVEKREIVHWGSDTKRVVSCRNDEEIFMLFKSNTCSLL